MIITLLAKQSMRTAPIIRNLYANKPAVCCNSLSYTHSTISVTVPQHKLKPLQLQDNLSHTVSLARQLALQLQPAMWDTPCTLRLSVCIGLPSGRKFFTALLSHNVNG